MSQIPEIALQAFQLLSPLVAAAITWAAAELAQWIQSNVKQTYLRGLLTRLDDAVSVVVKELQQTVVDEIKAASEDGSISDAEQLQIRDKAISKVKTYLGPTGLRLLARVLGVEQALLDSFIGTRVEAAVHDLRASKRKAISTDNPLAPFVGPAA